MSTEIWPKMTLSRVLGKSEIPIKTIMRVYVRNCERIPLNTNVWVVSIPDESSNGGLDSGNGLGMLSNGYYRDRDVYSNRADYPQSTAAPGGVGNRFEAGNNNQSTSGEEPK